MQGRHEDGRGLPEYIVLLRKPQTNRSKGYADEPVRKEKAAYTRARWQVDAHAFWRSSGNRLMTAEELAKLGPGKLAKIFTQHSLADVYDYEAHVRIGEQLRPAAPCPPTSCRWRPAATTRTCGTT